MMASVSGTLAGPSQVPKLVEVNGRNFDLRAQGEAVLLEYPDRPGVMGLVGTLLVVDAHHVDLEPSGVPAPEGMA